MTRRSWLLLIALSALWGSSYLFIKVALDDGVPPAVIVAVRTALAALVLLPIAAYRGALHGLRANLGPILLLAVVQMGGPLLLIAAGEQHISSSLTGILVATAPIFTFLLAFVQGGQERASGVGLAGVAIGIGGVALLLGFETDGAGLGGGLMIVAASLGYAIGGWVVKRGVRDVEPVAMVGATAAVAALLTTPAALLAPPERFPGVTATASLVVLGVLCTGAAFVIFYALVASDGPARASLVGYIAPGFSVVYGVTLLSERFTLATIAGLVTITGGSWLAAEGRRPWRRRPTVAEQPPPAADEAAAEAQSPVGWRTA